MRVRHRKFTRTGFRRDALKNFECLLHCVKRDPLTRLSKTQGFYRSVRTPQILGDILHRMEDYLGCRTRRFPIFQTCSKWMLVAFCRRKECTFIVHRRYDTIRHLWISYIGTFIRMQRCRILHDHINSPYILPDRLNGKSYHSFLPQVLSELLRPLPIPVGVQAHRWNSILEYCSSTTVRLHTSSWMCRTL